MDYELHVSDLETQKGKFTSLKSSAGDLVDACDSLKGKITGEISSLNKKVEDASKKISTGYDSYETWIEGYVTDLETTENTLASGIKAPALKGDFTNTFAKILIPALKNGASDEDKKKVQELGNLFSGSDAIITLQQVQNCKTEEEYLELVMPVYTYYCKKYGIKYPGVLALQPVYEHSAPTGIYSSCATVDNNLGGLKYSDSIPHATPGTYPGDGTGGRYSHFNNITEYIEAACWNIAKGSYYTDAMAQDNMDGFATSMINTWVGHAWGNYGPELIAKYKEYGLEKYEL